MQQLAKIQNAADDRQTDRIGQLGYSAIVGLKGGVMVLGCAMIITRKKKLAYLKQGLDPDRNWLVTTRMYPQ